ncbi:MAG: hypothetical protein OES47_10525, partial [Acidobacteriota bacterium]|nr:hypothetical protein [Acidobacteriota bacterium]
LGGSTEEVERRLAELDAELLEAAREAFSAEERSRLDESIVRGLERVRTRMEPREEAEIRSRLERQALRRMRDLPLLSLFSPAAE